MIRTARRLLLSSILVFASLPIASAQGASTPRTGKASVTEVPAGRATASEADKLDINTATPVQLKALQGVGEAYAKRIIDGRPYTAKNQLTSRGILPQATYDGIKELIVARAVKR